MRFEPIAVVGRGCVMPDAPDPDTFWDNVLAGRVSLRDTPQDRRRLSDAWALGDPADCTDRTWSRTAGYVTDFAASGPLDPSLDPVFQWTWHGAAAALREAGQEQLLHRAGLVLGNLSFPTTGMASYAEHIWLRDQRPTSGGPPPDPRNRFMSGLPAHLTARELGLGLGGFALDAACASALYAIGLACRKLQERRADLMVAGGVNSADDLFLQVSFCSLAAMSRSGSSRPFHRDADGLVPAEGAAFVALMRLDDALAAGAPVFGVIRGIGLSNDGRGSGLLVPSEDGQERAMRQAYEAAGVAPESVGLLECHATGTPVGDAVEVRSAARVFTDSADLPAGSAKSNVGHLITAAGAAGLLKALGALRAGIRPPTVGAEEPLAALAGTPLRLLHEPEEWTGPRRAAVSAFGFGGNNAHLIVDAWTGDDSGTPALPPPPRTPRTPEPIAVVAVGARVGDGRDLHDLRDALFAGQRRDDARNTVEVALDGLRFPPLDLEHTHAQQLLVLEAAREAADGTVLPGERTMVLIGMGCDPEVARYITRWRIPELLDENSLGTGEGTGNEVGAPDHDRVRELRDAVQSPQSASAVVGTMPNLVANRISAQLDLTGPGFTISAEEASGFVALEVGARALRAGDADAVLVGAVDLAHEPVHRAALAELGRDDRPGDAAVVLVLKRLADARADGDTVLALLDTELTDTELTDTELTDTELTDTELTDTELTDGELTGTELANTPPPESHNEESVARRWTVGDPTQPDATPDHFDPADLFGRAHAASGLLAVVSSALALHHRAVPRAGAPARPALRARTAVAGVDPLGGPVRQIRLRAADPAPYVTELPRRVHVFSGHSRADVVRALAEGRESADGPARLALAAAGPEDLADRTEAARKWLAGEGGARPDLTAFRDRPVGGEVAFVFSGGSMAYAGMGADVMLAFPDLLAAVEERSGPLHGLVGWAHESERPRPRHALDQIWGASVLGQLHARITRTLLRIEPQASLGYSSGESSALASLGAWTDVTGLSAQARRAQLFADGVVGELKVPRRAWRKLGVEGTVWASYQVEEPVDRVRAAIGDEPGVHLMVVNTPDSCVFGGEASGCLRVLDRLGTTQALHIPYQVAAHVPELAEIRDTWWRMHHLPTTDVGVRFYTCSTSRWYRASADAAADALTEQALGPIDFGRTVEQAWEDGVRVFVEHGPRSHCAGWIRRVLGDREHVAVSLDAPVGRGIGQLLRATVELVAAGVEADTDALCDRLAAARPEPRSTSRRLTLPAHPPAIRLPDPGTPPAHEVMSRAPRLPSTPEYHAVTGTGTGMGAAAGTAPARGTATRSAPTVVGDPDRILLPAPAAAPLPVLAEAPAAPVGVTPAHGTLTHHPAMTAVMETQHLAVSAHRHFLAVQAQVHEEFLATRQRAAAHLLSAHLKSAGSPPNAIGSPPHPSPPPSLLPMPSAPVAAAAPAAPPTPTAPDVSHGPVFTRADLERLATGPVSALFGPLFAAQDQYRRQTRMPAPPMLLADRVTGIDAEPASMGTGTIRTETDVRPDSWYLDSCGRMPAGIMVEAGQADLLLISWLGVDLLNRGERVYRLLGCELTYHGSPPLPGETLRYEIHIDGHGEHGGIRLFFFHYDCYVGDELRLTMRGGQAGFFTDEELARTGGVLWDPQTETPDPALPFDPPPVSSPARSFGPDAVRAFAEGRPFDCFGTGWELTRSHIRSPRTGDGRLRLLHEITEFDPVGGPWGRGCLRAVTQVSPDDWFFEGHFPEDPCMPGTLMFEGCLQAMAFHLAALGCTVDRDGWRFEPVPGNPVPMLCRGQVTPDSRQLTYEVFVSGLSTGPEPELVADVLCTVDGVKAFHARGVRLRLVPDWPLTHWRHLGPAAVQPTGAPVPHPALAGLVGHHETTAVAEAQGFRYDYASMLACAWGKPSEAFGAAYAPFDSARRLARLPGPPFHFMSRAVAVEGPAWVPQAGSAVEVEYDVPDQVWYFEQNGFPVMPLGVLMEVVLQASGWLASYVGSALGHDEDLLFRNLDGTGTVLREIRPGTKVLRTRTRLLDIAHSGDMIIETFGVECFADGEPVFSLTTVFGFFPPEAFENQIGLPPSDDERRALERPCDVSVDLGTRPAKYFDGPLHLPGPMLLMLDRVTGWWPEGGRAGLGRLRAEKDVDADEWFFKAHFFQDPVQPGSLGVQAMYQLLQFYVLESGLGDALRRPRFEPVLPGRPLTWKYRGQVTPRNRTITVELEVTETGETERGAYAVADAWLWADGTRIYHVTDLGIGLTEDDG
ncbi:beta-ketoacyl synthase N-terminal-like domain-containing protein [Streptomyces sp. WI04-05B]|uniref:beta-ketoacyl synthase N-terminal-like domain-containing protein n=1 Tax=Streptomyces TaxID=1883 RepID=UPI0029B1A780|nr:MULTISPECIES: beta-ketoacyl synthase N-terminal-like domain-containing protein [unclassified Streptomyces]MDX2546222.1 beta-ketoacyl synthase N-terminal-like domain-containing protein [Streptomyces sp. WI04-05B]MDX2583245.1 beta-ketoacyl synthase N-terminal-like domain-containing protein [Streptomyces sp. WI04-05A]